MEYDEKYLNQQIIRYEYIIKIILAKYKININDYNDAFQEGRIGLLKAIKAYDENISKSFPAFASICINNQIISFLRNKNRKKNRIHNLYNILNYDDLVNGIIKDKSMYYNVDGNNFEKIYRQYIFKNALQKFTDLEKKIIYYYIIGYSVNEISKKYNVSKRRIYFIISKIKKIIENKLNNV